MEKIDEIMKDEDVRLEIDRRVSEEMEKARSAWEDEMRRSIENAVAEAKRQESLSEDEKIAERMKALDERERRIGMMENRTRAAQMLAEKGLPVKMAEVLTFEDGEACDRGIEMLDSAFRQAVQAEVVKKLGSEKPAAGSPVTLRLNFRPGLRLTLPGP